VTVALHRRALIVIDALCKALCAREHEVRLVRAQPAQAGTKKACFIAIVRGCELEVSLVEILDQRERARTALEEDRAAFSIDTPRKEIPLPRESYASGRLRLIELDGRSVRTLHVPVDLDSGQAAQDEAARVSGTAPAKFPEPVWARSSARASAESSGC
jgi:hypothetical protein